MFVKIEIHDPGKSAPRQTPPEGSIRLIYRPAAAIEGRDAPHEDVVLADVPMLVESALRSGAVEHARSLKAAWFTSLAHRYGHTNIAVD